MRDKLILFITPTGGRTGSEMLLWYLLNRLKGKIKSAVFSLKDGELFKNNSTADQTFLYKSRKGFIYSIYEGIYFKIFKITPEEAYLIRIQKKINPSRWYLNTMVMPRFARLAHRLAIPYDVHVHELPTVYDEINLEEFKFQFDHAERIICCSTIVEKRIRQMGYQNTLVKHSFIDTQKIQITQNSEILRKNLQIPSESFVWLMSGSMNLRKGYEIIPDLMSYLPKNTYLVWLGSTKNTGVLHYIRASAQENSYNFIEIPEKSNEYYDYFNIADGFVLTAKEDPFPLVMIEAAYLQKPIVGFNSGGISEFLRAGMGAYVDSFNPKDLAEIMIKIQNKTIVIDKNLLKQRALEFDLDNQIGNWDNLFD